MNLEKAVKALLDAHAGVTALTTRIYASRAPAGGNATPYVVFSKVSTTTHGAVDGPNTLEECDCQVDTYADTAAESLTLAEQVRLCLDGVNQTVGGVVVRGTIRTNQFSADPLAPTDGGDGPRYRVVILITVFFHQAVS